MKKSDAPDVAYKCTTCGMIHTVEKQTLTNGDRPRGHSACDVCLGMAYIQKSETLKLEKEERKVNDQYYKGTAHFITTDDAERYYQSQCYEEGYAETLLKEGTIFLGPPAISPMEKLIINKEEGRYFIRTKTSWGK